MTLPPSDPTPSLTLSDFDFELPEAQIAAHPLAGRDQSRLAVLGRESGTIDHRHFHELPTLLQPGDLLVLNDTRVFPARIFGHKQRSGGKVELLLLAGDGGSWRALARGRLKVGDRLEFADDLSGQITELHGDGQVQCDFAERDVMGWLQQHGEMPLPPYIKRPRTAADKDRYQTVFGCHTGSVAAPTSGLHFTDDLLARLKTAGIYQTFVTLHVGPGTFLPVRTERIDDHIMHPEQYHIPADTVAAIAAAKARDGRIIACGTTVTRALESAVDTDGTIATGAGSSRLFITPGYRFGVVDGLITNFHLPRSTLLMLVSAMTGRERLLAAYKEAVTDGYRFFSYGDAMLIAPTVRDSGAAGR